LYPRPGRSPCNSRSIQVSSSLIQHISYSSRGGRYPAQEQVGGDSKIPSILYYDLQGDVRAVGAEALQERIIEQAEDEGWVKLEWYVYCARN
jgi:hypothetical protein